MNSENQETFETSFFYIAAFAISILNFFLNSHTVLSLKRGNAALNLKTAAAFPFSAPYLRILNRSVGVHL